MTLPWAIVARRRRTSASTATTSLESVNINARRLRRGVPAAESGSDADAGARPGADAVSTDLMRAFRGYSSITPAVSARLADVSTRCRCRSTAGSATACRSGSTTRSACRSPAARRARLQHNADGTVLATAPTRRRPTSCSATTIRQPHIMKGELRVGSAGPAQQPAARPQALGLIVNDWQLSGIWTAATGTRRTPSASAIRTAAAT